MNTEQSLNKSAQCSAKLTERLMSFIGGDVDSIDTVEEAIAESIVALVELCKIFDADEIYSHVETKLEGYKGVESNKLLARVIKEIVKDSDSESTYRDLIFRYVCDLCGITIDELMGNNGVRELEYVIPRQLIMYAYREFKAIKKPQAEIGDWFGKDHATVLHAHKSMLSVKETKSDKNILRKLKRLDNYISTMLA